MGLILAVLIPILIFLAILVFYIICCWKIFTKAGQPGWAILIPIYDAIIMLKIVSKPWWWLLVIIIVPIYGWIVVPIQLIHKLSKAFGHDVGFTLGLIFLSFIFIPILAFEKNTYTKPV